MAVSLSLINMKGGVGKTTLAMQIALTAAGRGLRVLAVDLDPQSNLSQALMRPRAYVEHLKAFRPTIVDLFEKYRPASRTTPSPSAVKIQDAILKKSGHSWGRDKLDLIPGRLELSHTLKNPTGKERRLAKALASVREAYDLIVIDCAPTESILTEAAYFASRYVLVPIKPEFMATIGLPLLARSMEEFRIENADHALDMLGIVFNHSSSYSSGPEGRQAISEVTGIAADNGWPLFDTQICYSASYARAARESSAIASTSHARWNVVTNFRSFFDEFAEKSGISVGSS